MSPIPKPLGGEEEAKFIRRCVANNTMKKEYPDYKQRIAVCYSAWRKVHGGEKPEEKSTTKYDCECLKCGYKMQTESHCRETKCPKCGTLMRRASSPGPGK